METHEYEDDTVPHAILAHEKQLAVEKATLSLLKAEISRPSLDHDESLEREAGQTYIGINLFQ